LNKDLAYKYNVKAEDFWYKDKIYTLKELAGLNLARKKQAGIIIREIIFSKLGLMTFTV